MRIQYIYNKGTSKIKSAEIECTRFDSPKSFDEFDVNIIDLTSDHIWENNANSTHSINCANDLRTMREMIDHSRTASIIIAFPSIFP